MSQVDCTTPFTGLAKVAIVSQHLCPVSQLMTPLLHLQHKLPVMLEQEATALKIQQLTGQLKKTHLSYKSLEIMKFKNAKPPISSNVK